MYIRIILLIGGVIFSYSAFDIIQNKGFIYFGYYINLRESYLSIGLIFFALAVLSFLIAIRINLKKKEEKN
jgi:hypothetical protein